MEEFERQYFQGSGTPAQANAPEAASSADRRTVSPTYSVPGIGAQTGSAGQRPYAGQQQTGAYGQTPQAPYSAYPSYTAQPTPTRAAPVGETQQPKRKKSRIWIPIVIVAALLLGIFGGAAGFSQLSTRLNSYAPAETPSMEQPTLSQTIQPETTPNQERIENLLNNPNNADEYMAPAMIYSNYATAVVGIASEATGTNIFGQRVTQASSGTGFIITEDGYVLTNYHVVEGANNITVQLFDGTEYPATLVGYESITSDVALLKINASGLTTVALGDSDQVVVGEQVCTIGNPLGELTFSLTVGYLSAKDRAINTDGTPINMLQTDCTINSGNSGGPLFDANGNVIGITTAKYSGSTSTGASIDGLNFAIPINDVKEIISDLMSYGYVTGRPYLGITVGDASAYGTNLPAGAYVAEVLSGGPADQAGMKADDVIVGMDDSVISSYADLSAFLNKCSVGDQIAVTVYRSGSYITLNLTLGERPADFGTSATEEPTEEPAQQDPFGFGQDGNGGWPFP